MQRISIFLTADLIKRLAKYRAKFGPTSHFIREAIHKALEKVGL